MTPAEQTRRATFGAGIAQGLRMAGIENPGDFMNANKLARIESGLNGMAKKVLDAVPIQDAWTKGAICAEVRRAGTSTDLAVIEGCLDTLRERGLIKEPTRGTFIRIQARQPISILEDQSAVQTNIRPIAQAANDAPATAPAPAAADTLTRLANLGALLRRAADEADALALDVEERVKAAGQDGEKLRQLQALLKSIGV